MNDVKWSVQFDCRQGGPCIARVTAEATFDTYEDAATAVNVLGPIIEKACDELAKGESK